MYCMIITFAKYDKILDFFITRLSEIVSCNCGEQTKFWGMCVVKKDKGPY